MGRVLKWAAVILGLLVLALIAVVFVVGVLRFGGMAMMARGFGFREPFVYGGYRYLIWPMLIGRLLLPLAFIALLVLGGFAIGRALSRPRPMAVVSAASGTCPNCGRPVTADWNNCPYCGTALRPGVPPVVPPGEPPAVQNENG